VIDEDVRVLAILLVLKQTRTHSTGHGCRLKAPRSRPAAALPTFVYTELQTLKAISFDVHTVIGFIMQGQALGEWMRFSHK
jgi:hypothetical protein